jgi:hypothetical protein
VLAQDHLNRLLFKHLSCFGGTVCPVNAPVCMVEEYFNLAAVRVSIAHKKYRDFLSHQQKLPPNSVVARAVPEAFGLQTAPYEPFDTTECAPCAICRTR